MAGTITAIRLQKKNPRRASLYLDGRFVLGLAVEVAQDLGLHRGQVLSDADLEALRQAEEQRQAYQYALRLLSYRLRSTAEVRQRVAGKGYADDQAEAVVARLTELGLLDDRVFAQTWVENRRALRPRGRQALQAELRQKGLAAGVIAAALEEARVDEGEAEQALALARERAAALVGLERPDFFRRLQGYLARRGFSPDAVVPAVRRVWEEVGQAGSAESDEV